MEEVIPHLVLEILKVDVPNRVRKKPQRFQYDAEEK